MKNKHAELIISAFVVDEESTFTLADIQKRFSIDDALLHDMIEYGLIETQESAEGNNIPVNQLTLQRIQTALHLNRDLGVNIAGSVLVLDILEELLAVRRELAMLKKHFD